MYGYVVPLKAKLQMCDYVLYRSFYCGICKVTGANYGQLPRFTTNYDMTFLAVLLHDFMRQDVAFKEGGCVCNPFQKKATVLSNPLMERIVGANIILVYHSIADNVADEGKLKYKLASKVMSKNYRKAKRLYPKIDEIVANYNGKLAEMERNKVSGIDIVADCFASLMSQIALEIVRSLRDEQADRAAIQSLLTVEQNKLAANRSVAEDEQNKLADEQSVPTDEQGFHANDSAEGEQNILADESFPPQTDDKLRILCYNIGKFVYLIDGLDDVDEDFKEKRYNPFLAEFDNFANRKQFFVDNRVAIDFSLNTCINRCIESLNGITLTQSSNLLRNIIYYGLRDKYYEIMSSNAKLAKPKI